MSDFNAGISIPNPGLLLHCCCAPCAGSVIERLLPEYRITLLFFNPNIRPSEEFDRRAAGMRQLISAAAYGDGVELIICGHDAGLFDSVALRYPEEPEGGERCRACFELRLERAALLARDGGYDCFTTTLSVSPYKNAAELNSIGDRLGQRHGVRFLRSDFKKHDGYKRSVELSKQYGLYRQSYCGCRENT